jgi:hypothetical protein
MKVQIVTPYRVSHLQRYGVTVRGNVTSVYPPKYVEYPLPTRSWSWSPYHSTLYNVHTADPNMQHVG